MTYSDPTEFLSTVALGPNWHLQFTEPDGTPMNMGSLEEIDFGAISYKEIFQNVKTILATPLESAALARDLGVDQGIVDRPINEASRKRDQGNGLEPDGRDSSSSSLMMAPLQCARVPFSEYPSCLSTTPTQERRAFELGHADSQDDWG